jgi:hypothetical protein
MLSCVVSGVRSRRWRARSRSSEEQERTQKAPGDGHRRGVQHHRGALASVAAHDGGRERHGGDGHQEEPLSDIKASSARLTYLKVR